MGKAAEKVPPQHDRIRMSELASISGVSKATIYTYLKMGILHQPHKASLGRSVYDSSHLLRLKHIRELRENHKLPLSEIKQIISKPDAQKLLESHENETGLLMTAIREEKENLRIQKVDKKRNEILDVAITIFSKNGYENTTIEAIAEALQMGKSTVYLYFDSKEELFMKCMERLAVVAVPYEAWDEIRREKNPLNRIQKRGYFFLKAFPSYRGILSMVRAALGGNNAQLAQKAKDILTLMTRPLTKEFRWGMDAGMFRKDIDVELMAHIILSIGEGLGFLLTMDSRYDVETVMKNQLELLTKGILSHDETLYSKTDTSPVRGEVTDTKGFKTRLENIHLKEKDIFPLSVGDAKIEIDLKKIRRIKMSNQSDRFSAQITLDNEQDIKGEVDDSLTVIGETGYGRFSIKLKKVAQILLDSEKS
jgi:AcrR family transcriptional regulator